MAKEKFTVRDLLRKSTGELDFFDFLQSKGIQKINEEIRDSLLKEKINIDLSKKALNPTTGNWTDIEVKYIRKAFKNLISTINKDEGVSVIGDKIFIETKGGKQFKNIFRRSNIYFDLITKEAGSLIKKDFNAKKLSERDAQILSIKIEKGEVLTDNELYSLAYSRLIEAKPGAAGRVFEVQKGHIEGHENWRLAAAKRIAYAMKVSGIEELPKELKEEIDYILNIDTDVLTKFSQQFAIQLEKGTRGARIPENLLITQVITIERGRFNTLKGAKEEAIAQEIILNNLAKLFKVWAAKDTTINKMTTLGFSPSFLQRVETSIMGLLLGNQGAKYNKKAIEKPKSSIKAKSVPLKIDISTKAKKLVSKAIKKPNKKTAAKGFKVAPIDVLNIRNLINTVLSKNVEEQMADSTSTDGRLRYQTGRFADSANLLTLTRSQAGSLVGTYTYLRNPYDVFLPGHKMATSKRDPRIYVEGAIRKSAMEILKNKFPGIVLELK